MRPENDYLAYLMRLWREGDRQSWRASLEDPHTGERQGFANLRRMFEFIEAQTRPHSSAGPLPPHHGTEEETP